MNVKPSDFGALPSPRELGGANWKHAVGAGCAGRLAVFVLGVLGLAGALVMGWVLPDTAWAWPELGAGLTFALVLVRWGFAETRNFTARQNATERVWEAHRARAEGILSVTSLLVELAEQTLQRDLDGDGVVGVAVPPPKRLVPYRAGERQTMLALNSQAALPEPATTPPGGLVELPGGVTVNEGDLRAFVEGLYSRGLSRRAWAGQRLPSGQNVSKVYHQKLLAALATLGLVTGRGERETGRLVYATVSEALAALELE